MVRFPGGAVTVGTDDRASAYDNERPRHLVEVAPFRIDVDPVSNGDLLIFIGAGGTRPGNTGRRRAGPGSRRPA